MVTKFSKIDKGNVVCTACAQFCNLSKQRTGKCGVRILSNQVNAVEKIEILNYQRITGLKIEELTNAKVLSITSFGCTFKCTYCRDWDISHFADIYSKEFGRERSYIRCRELGELVKPSEVLSYAQKKHINTLCFNHSEPLANLEYYLEIMELAKQNGLKNIWHTNGYFSKESLESVVGLIDFLYIDLKSMNRDFYRKHYKAELDIVLENIRKLYQLNIPLAIIYTLIPSGNDEISELTKVYQFLSTLSFEIPLVFQKFYPEFRMQDKECTSPSALESAVHSAKSFGFKNVSFVL